MEKIMTKNTKIEASTARSYEINAKDLPLCCPMPNMYLWDSHPRVYLPIKKTGHSVCPYCGSEYFLKSRTTKQQV